MVEAKCFHRGFRTPHVSHEAFCPNMACRPFAGPERPQSGNHSLLQLARPLPRPPCSRVRDRQRLPHSPLWTHSRYVSNWWLRPAEPGATVPAGRGPQRTLPECRQFLPCKGTHWTVLKQSCKCPGLLTHASGLQWEGQIVWRWQGCRWDHKVLAGSALPLPGIKPSPGPRSSP